MFSNLAKSHLGEGFVYFTTDGTQAYMVECGHIDGAYASVDFGSGLDAKAVNDSFQIQRIVSPRGELDCTIGT
jgi:hypothetical protein